MSTTSPPYNRLGCIARFKPLHLGSAAMLDGICSQADEIVIGIGSANKYNARNPWTAEESAEMIKAYLQPRYSHYSLVTVPDFAHIPEYADGQRWRKYVQEQFGSLDGFVTRNEYVKELLKDDYSIIETLAFVPPAKRVPIKGSLVRLEMARFGNWPELVPTEVADYLGKNGLVERFRKEFGLETLAHAVNSVASTRLVRLETKEEEKIHTQEK